MNAEELDWKDLEPDLDRLLALDEALRPAALRALESSDAARAAALRQWLSDIEQSPGLLEPPPPRPRALSPGAPWRLLQPIGSGGMGEVWLGERADGAFERRVAIKFLRADRAALGDRLIHERELLARFRHPGIAMLLDGGVAAGGEPYLVTEWIDGARLDHWVRDQAPDLRARVEVLRRITEAVAYAHANLIVHRDLKPANVMIDRAGAPHLLDFGIARLLDDVDLGTLTNDHALTPAFAAPEQLTGQSITTRSDVYALGGLLFWMICGRTPHDTEGLALAELVKRVCERDLPAPSALAASPAIPRAADLDAIALKALSREPAERYRSADALAQDLGRWMEGETVSARLPTRVERSVRFMRRYRVATALTATTVVALIAGVAGTTWQARRAAVERDAALAETDRSEMVLDSFARMFREAGSEERLNASEWLARAVKMQDRADAVDPAARSRILLTLAGIEQDRGQAEGARVLLERVLGAAGAALSESERAVARCRLGAAYSSLGKHDRALTELSAGIAAAEAFTGIQRLALSDCLSERAAAGLRSDQPGSADIQAAERALLELDRVGTGRDLRWRRAGVLYNLAVLQDITGNAAEAARRYGEVSRIDIELGNLETTDHAMLITAQAGAFNLAGQVRDADLGYAEGIALAERIGGKTPNLATDLVNHANVKNRLAAFEDAAAVALRAIAIFTDLQGANPIGHANAHFELGKALTGLKRHQEARSALEEAEKRMRAIDEAANRVPPILIASARLQLASGEADAAKRTIDAVIAALRDAGSKGQLADALQVSAHIALAQGNVESAEMQAREAVAAFDDNDSARALAAAAARLSLAEILLARGTRPDERRQLANSALAAMQAAFGADHPQVRAARAVAGA